MSAPLPVVEILSLSPALATDELLRSMGVADGRPIKRRLAKYLREAIEAAASHAQPKLAWAFLPADRLAPYLPVGRRLARYLEGASHCALVAGTVGIEWDRQIRGAKDPFYAYLYAAVATALARGVLQKARRELRQRFPQDQIADSLSPGTDGLPLPLQAKLNDLNLFEPIGIRFDRSALLMEPLASVTGLIAFGPSVAEPAALPDCAAPQPRCPSCPDRRCALRVQPPRGSLAVA